VLFRRKCWCILQRLHLAGFAQGSFYERNILVQPGPLSLPPSQRSGNSPSYRIIDFGRGGAEGDAITGDLDNARARDQEYRDPELSYRPWTASIFPGYAMKEGVEEQLQLQLD